MILYLLEPIKQWHPWYDKMFGIVIRAKNSLQARRIAAKHAGDEGSAVWLDPTKTSCERIHAKGPVEVILRRTRDA